MYGICSTSIKTSTTTDENVIRRALLRRSGVGWRSCQMRSSHGVGFGNEKSLNIQLSHDRHRRSSYAEQIGIGVLNTNTNREPRRQMHPIEGPFDVGQSGDHASVLREHAIPNTLHHPGEPFLWMSHEVHIDERADADAPHFRLTIVRDNPPLASVDEREHRSARSGVGALRGVLVGYVGIERRDDAASLEVEPGAINPCGQTRPLGLKDIQGVDNMNRLPELCS